MADTASRKPVLSPPSARPTCPLAAFWPLTLACVPGAHRWERVPGVTLLGDAAHLMIPSGEGANLAMYDGAELAQAIAAHPGDVEAALAANEKALFPRSAAAAADLAEGFGMLFGDSAPPQHGRHVQQGANGAVKRRVQARLFVVCPAKSAFRRNPVEKGKAFG
jgi:2-polyprenyl-6-methoxyphenol hydroxylase-like FAD-dependent oxidoreductase